MHFQSIINFIKKRKREKGKKEKLGLGLGLGMQELKNSCIGNLLRQHFGPSCILFKTYPNISSYSKTKNIQDQFKRF